jgi:hypothetical protein
MMFKQDVANQRRAGDNIDDIVAQVDDGHDPLEAIFEVDDADVLQTIVNPEHLRRRPFFVRLRDLGQCVAFVPTQQSGDGKKGVAVTMSSFWDREQYVVYCYPRSNYDE